MSLLVRALNTIGPKWLTLFTKSDLAELGGPIFPNIVSNTRSDNDRNDDGEEDAHARWTVLLVELIAVAGAGVSNADFHLLAALAGVDGDLSVAGGFVPLDFFGIIGAEERMVCGCEALNECTRTVGLALVVKVTALELARAQ